MRLYQCFSRLRHMLPWQIKSILVIAFALRINVVFISIAHLILKVEGVLQMENLLSATLLRFLSP